MRHIVERLEAVQIVQILLHRLQAIGLDCFCVLERVIKVAQLFFFRRKRKPQSFFARSSMIARMRFSDRICKSWNEPVWARSSGDLVAVFSHCGAVDIIEEIVAGL